MGDVAYGIFGLLLLGIFGWAIVGILRRAEHALRDLGRGGLGAQLRHGSPGQRRAQAERRLRATEERLVARLGFVAESRSVLLADREFIDAVDAVEQLHLPTDDLIAIALDDQRPWGSRIAVACLARLDGTPAAWAAVAIRRLTGSDWDYAGLLLLSLERSPAEVLGPALSKIDEVLPEDLAALLRVRTEEKRESLDTERVRRNVPRSLAGHVSALLEEHGPELPASVRAALGDWLASVPAADPPARPRERRQKMSQRTSPPPYQSLVYERAGALEERYGHSAASCTQLLEDPLFLDTVDEVVAQHRSSETPVEALLELARDNRAWVGRIALGALARCDDEIPASWPAAAVRRLENAPWDYAGLVLLALERAPGEVIGPVLARMHEVLAADLAGFLRARVESAGEVFDLERMQRHVDAAQRDQITALLEEYRPSLPAAICATFDRWLAEHVDLGPELSRLVRVWSRPFMTDPVVRNSTRTRLAEEIAAEVTRDHGRSLILIGEHGVGKTALIRTALDTADASWSVFEAGAGQLNAGAMYIGQLEARVEEVVERLSGRRVIWVFPEFGDALFAGAYRENPSGLIDRLLPHLERGSLRIIGEVTPDSYELLIARRPAVRSALQPLRLRPLDEEETVELSRDVLAASGIDVDEDATLRETYDLAQQFLPGVSPPGNVLRLLRGAVQRVEEDGRTSLSTSDVIATLSLLSGIPLAMLDPTQPLGLDSIRAFLESRVIGQREATDVLVDRVALVKSGLTDPTRPLGVFLFVGPTGTGKTELAKALTELLFGNPSRLVRLDMSEYQTPDSLERLLGDANTDANAAPLIAAVRRDPFSVVLLDEFEKAAAPIRDLFLQLFDDGRLTDRSGRTTDFRRCVVIMTSNVGSALQSGPGVGFDSRVEPFRPGDVDRALRRTFRPEFLNRIDRIVVFQPFERDEIRMLLQKELDEVVLRRGMRDRPWAIEIDETAIAFLIERGFTPDLGARPLKRAVEQYVLTPLARAIADGQVPTGDQFLFLTAGADGLDVRFVGLEPDAASEAELVVADRDEGAPGDAAAPEDLSADAELRALLRSPAQAAAAPERLDALLAGILAVVDDAVSPRKHELLDEISQDGFWNRGDRFSVLAEAEYLDRLEAATRTAERLAERLRQADGGRARAEVALLLANRVYVLDRALAGLRDGAPFEVALRICLAAGSETSPEAVAFLEDVGAMYAGWAVERGMKLRELASSDGSRLCAVSGLGAGTILRGEAGLHVCELVTPGDEEPHVERVAVSVEVAEIPPGEPVAEAELARRVAASLDGVAFPGQVTRRYQPGPSPLVRDSVRGYRTGRLDRVLAGGFDLFEA